MKTFNSSQTNISKGEQNDLVLEIQYYEILKTDSGLIFNLDTKTSYEITYSIEPLS